MAARIEWASKSAGNAHILCRGNTDDLPAGALNPVAFASQADELNPAGTPGVLFQGIKYTVPPLRWYWKICRTIFCFDTSAWSLNDLPEGYSPCLLLPGTDGSWGYTTPDLYKRNHVYQINQSMSTTVGKDHYWFPKWRTETQQYIGSIPATGMNNLPIRSYHINYGGITMIGLMSALDRYHLYHHLFPPGWTIIDNQYPGKTSYVRTTCSSYNIIAALIEWCDPTPVVTEYDSIPLWNGELRVISEYNGDEIYKYSEINGFTQ